MLTKKHISFLLAFLFIQGNLLAQEKLNIKFGKVTTEDFNVKSGLIDSSTNAVILADVGKSQFIANPSDVKDVSLQTKIGQYKSSVKVTGDKIIFYRSMEQNSGRFPAKEFDQLVKFYDQVYKSDRSKVVLVKSE